MPTASRRQNLPLSHEWTQKNNKSTVTQRSRHGLHAASEHRLTRVRQREDVPVLIGCVVSMLVTFSQHLLTASLRQQKPLKGDKSTYGGIEV